MKKGFTLIELLAVIIILAVIALIATPVVLNVVEEAKVKADRNSVYGLIDAAKLYYAESMLDTDKKAYTNGTTNVLDYLVISGEGPKSGKIFINDKGQSAIAVVYGKVCFTKNFTDNDLSESDDIENCELGIEETVSCEYEIGKTFEFAYTGDIQEFTVPCEGTYKLEVWGAQGGSGNHGAGGNGGYSIGNQVFTTDTNLYIVVGGSGKSTNGTEGTTLGGYNGGGSAHNTTQISGSGGGATHIAISTGVLSSLETTKESILIVAGGGGGGGTWVSNGATLTGGAGGGITGGDAYAYSYASAALNAKISRGGGGTQTSGGAVLGDSGTGVQVGMFGQGGASSSNGAGGGGGYYGGASGTGYNGATSAGGGSGYIDGVIDGETIAGNLEIPTHDGTSTMTGNTGDGYAKITLVSIEQ